MTSSILVWLSKDKALLNEIAISEINIKYSNKMIDRLQSDVILKRTLGKHTWSIDITDLVVKVYKDQLISIWSTW